MSNSRPEPGDAAPNFTAPVVGVDFDEGAEVTLTELRGKPVVLYFYPKDDTPGCTKQACAIRDAWGELSERAHLFGVSIDSPKKHQKFIDKYDLPFPLLSDEDKSIVEAYAVWVEKSMYGKKFWGIERTTFVIGADGVISAVLPKVKPDAHLDLLLEAL